MNWVSVPSTVISWSTKYVAANEWCAYALEPTVDAAITMNKTKSVRFMGPPPGTGNVSVSAASRDLFLRAQALEHRLDKHVGRPETRAPAIPRIVIKRRLGRLHLFERHSLVHHVLDSVSDDRNHFLVEDHVGDIAQPSVSGDDQSAAFLLVGGDG